jgi:helicase
LRGETGRVVLAASGAGEPALETLRFGHGLFSHHLIEALQGFGQFTTEERLPLYELLGHVTTRVVDSALRLGCVQTPALYGSIDGAPTLSLRWPRRITTSSGEAGTIRTALLARCSIPNRCLERV